MCAALVNMFHMIPAAPPKFIKLLTELILKGEKALLVEVRGIINRCSSSLYCRMRGTN